MFNHFLLFFFFFLFKTWAADSDLVCPGVDTREENGLSSTEKGLAPMPSKGPEVREAMLRPKASKRFSITVDLERYFRV